MVFRTWFNFFSGRPLWNCPKENEVYGDIGLQNGANSRLSHGIITSDTEKKVIVDESWKNCVADQDMTTVSVFTCILFGDGCE